MQEVTRYWSVQLRGWVPPRRTFRKDRLQEAYPTTLVVYIYMSVTNMGGKWACNSLSSGFSATIRLAAAIKYTSSIQLDIYL